MKSIISNQWRQIQRSNFTNWEKLADFLELDEHERLEISKKPGFILNLPLRLARKIEKGNLEDPILRQFLPTTAEEIVSKGFVVDPVGDHACRRASKLLHKYQGRVLLVTTSACAMHCRYCFRQNFDYDVEDKTFTEELEVIAQDKTIKEVILSGGDPLSLSNHQLQALFERIAEIPHINRLRIHSRFPIGIPERIDDHFLEMIKKMPKQVWFVIHCNHPNELDNDIFSHLKALQRLGVVVLNQSVLLRGVNDDVDAMAKLCETLCDNGVLPYYLHQLDRVQGAAHFEVSREEGLELIDQLIVRLPGYGVPKYVQEISGEPSKTPIK
jgi:EF-P beta-lysylation protein EpmB